MPASNILIKINYYAQYLVLEAVWIHNVLEVQCLFMCNELHRRQELSLLLFHVEVTQTTLCLFYVVSVIYLRLYMNYHMRSSVEFSTCGILLVHKF